MRGGYVPLSPLLPANAANVGDWWKLQGSNL